MTPWHPSCHYTEREFITINSWYRKVAQLADSASRQGFFRCHLYTKLWNTNTVVTSNDSQWIWHVRLVWANASPVSLLFRSISHWLVPARVPIPVMLMSRTISPLRCQQRGTKSETICCHWLLFFKSMPKVGSNKLATLVSNQSCSTIFISVLTIRLWHKAVIGQLIQYCKLKRISTLSIAATTATLPCAWSFQLMTPIHTHRGAGLL